MKRILDLFTWKMFTEAFNNKYFPKSLRQHKEREFIKLEQGSRIVTEYEAEFARLAKFAPDLVATEERRARRFEKGLRSRIKQAVIPFELTTYREVVSKSLLVERAQLLDKEEIKAQPSGHKFNGGNSRAQFWKNNGQKRRNDQGNNKGHHQNKQQRKTCSKCGKEHLGEMPYGYGCVL
ncbi:Retrotrans gag domain-containing protein [Abeliophyllum distichum]|uniref:Retrotrans gag domain-containing protein n=1 Tax=Abeliophyllum distichum TaxID=126358 RepID=A0ABD1PSU1_9LAMI